MNIYMYISVYEPCKTYLWEAEMEVLTSSDGFKSPSIHNLEISVLISIF